MGLLDLFKKKTVSVTFETVANSVSSYNPWDEKKNNSNSDYATANFLNMLSSQASPIKASADDYPRYLSYDLEISDPIKKHKELLKEGYLREASAAEVLNTFKVADLKSILDVNGLPAKGKKAELIKVVESIDPSALKLPIMYCVSEKGLAFMEQNNDLIKLFRNPYNITYEEYIATKNNRAISYNDVVWGIFNRREMFAGNSYGAKRINEYHRAKFLKSEGNFVEALRYYIHTLFFDLNDPSRIIPDWAKKDWDGYVSQINPEILESIFELKANYMPKMAEECYTYLEPSKILVKKKDFALLLNDIFEAKQIDVKNYLPKGCR